MTQKELFKTIEKHRLESFSSDEVFKFVDAQARVIEDLARENALLKSRKEDLKQISFQFDEEYLTIKGKFLGSSSTPQTASKEKSKSSKKRKKKVQLPSERYPEADVIEQEISFRDKPNCKCCGGEMCFSGMYEVCEYITITPAVFEVIRQKRQKFRCGGCHGDIKTVPPLPRIVPGSSYSDQMIIDVALSK